jgi:predicted RNA-binding protein Jag
MKLKQILLLVLAATVGLSCSILTAAAPTGNTAELAARAVSDEPKVAEIAIKELRELGRTGLEILFETYAVEIETFKKSGVADDRWPKIAKALDAVAMQKDVYASNLFWYTDVARARGEAGRTGKPILSLRLLGNLNEEFSCANSRFFRAILYPNAQISKFLQENYILHWQSVRPAPRITIDFGDGRKIERTITGNSIHYVLNRDGEVLDALSGLNSPPIFLNFLISGKWASDALAPHSQNPAAKRNILLSQRSRTYQALTQQMNWFGQKLNLSFDSTRKAARNFEEMPPAIAAMTIAMTKSRIEMPVLKSLIADLTKYGEDQINLENWREIARMSGREAKLDENSRAFIRRQTAKNDLTEQEFAQLIAKLEEFVSVDTARNEFLLRPTLLVWLAKEPTRDVSAFNEKVYTELFLTPSADKWLGLYAPDIYTALDSNGIK